MMLNEYIDSQARERRRWWIALWVMAITGPFIVVGVAKALAHEALPTTAKPRGWSYPFSCCSGIDCREVTLGPNGVVRETPEGYRIAATGEIIAYSDVRIKESPDGVAHWCSVAGADDSRTICLFVPPRSY